MTKDELDQLTRSEWRELGFFYALSQEKTEWRLVGSRDGLLKFSKILREYSRDLSHGEISAHEHYGPYSYLKLITWHEPQITAHAIAGTLDDFERLSELIKNKVENATSGSRVEIDTEFSSSNEAMLILDLKDDDFDPPDADPLLRLR